MPSFRIQRRCSCVATRWPARTCATWLWVRAIVSRLCAPHAKCGLSTRHQYGIIRSGTIRNCHFPSRPEGAWPPQIAVPSTNRRAHWDPGYVICDVGTRSYKSGRQASALLLLVGVPFGIDQSGCKVSASRRLKIP